MSKFTLHEVKTKKEAKQFLKVPIKIYTGYKNWIRPLDDDINKVFDPERNLLFKEGEAIRWILYDEQGEAVGRIAAFYNRKVASENEQPTGGCGFFECINDQEAANTLFDAAKAWLMSKGMEAMDGSINFGDRDQWWGVLVDGFTSPVYGMNYNHFYYKDLFEGYGFQNYFNQYSYRRDFNPTTIPENVVEKARRINENPDYQIRHIRKNELNEVARNFRNIYNKAWANFSGVAEMSQEQADTLVKTMKPIIDERLIYFAYYKGEPIGFFIMIPDINGAIKHLRGKFGLWHKLKFMYHLKIRKSCNIVLGLIFAVVPEHQGKGVESALIDCFKVDINSRPTHYKHLELAWIGDFNPLMMRMLESHVCAYRYKTHVTFRYLFDREKEFKRAPKVSKSRKMEEQIADK